MYKIKQKPEDFIVNEITNIKPKQKGEYSIFSLTKKDYNTESAVKKIAEKLNIPRKFISYAGNKDKLAITTQYISIKNAIIKDLKLNDITLEFKGYSDKPISLGDLEGNEFEIKVITKDKPKKIKKIINFFGEQRFSHNNKDIGKAIIKKDFKKAAELILENKGKQEEPVKTYLAEHPADFVGAIMKISLKILKLYTNAYQSYLWNKIAEETSKTAKKDELIPLIGFGTKPTKEIENTLQSEGLTQRDFIIKQIPELSLEGNKRQLFAEIKNLKIEKIKRGFNLKFKLKKGCYATEVIKQIFT